MNLKKAILLAGGSGTRMRPATSIINKHLLTIYDKPMIYYPLSTLMLGGIRDILVITNTNDLETFKKLLGNGDRFGIRIEYDTQDSPGGLPEAFIIGEKFIDNEPICLNLGDHILFGSGLSAILENIFENFKVPTIFSQSTNSPCDYGVVEFDSKNKPIKIIEKPSKPPSNKIITGLYAYTSDVVEHSKSLKKSDRNEIEITDLNNIYLKNNKMNIFDLGRGVAWFDAGNPQRILEVSNFINLIEKNQSNLVGCLEEIAFRKKFIDEIKLRNSINLYKNSHYGDYLKSILD